MGKQEVSDLFPESETEAEVLPFNSKPRHPDPAASAAKEAVYREPQIKALLRILGEDVLNIFPTNFTAAVEQGYQFWQTHPDSYIDTDFDTAQERNDTLIVMRAYAEIAGPEHEGYTIATKNEGPDSLLVWRAQPRRKHNRKDSE